MSPILLYISVSEFLKPYATIFTPLFCTLSLRNKCAITYGARCGVEEGTQMGGRKGGCFYPTSSKCGEVRSPHVAHKSFKNSDSAVHNKQSEAIFLV
jgi:hypothetical protein